MKRKRWTYKVYYKRGVNRVVAEFTSRVKAREFMATLTDQIPTMIGELR